ncbi:sarcosine oxidase subunit gamma [Allorhizobium sp. BGMRC 0089]|uniref:sarcosine oxidase subunit gamma n=1 Tax=Allorhizobium sonneratiae TaxID=2934936 RepID=UPI002033BEB1|nr:sarcosine oxidase subunit gamma [Allorhizobium sonneratiae]MCM2290821.1 sarcosine oxidase subunit gamma [Allorhizobium sonneratiae]
MAKAKAKSPLAERQTVLEGMEGGTARARITLASPAARVNLRAGEEALAALSASLGLDLPQQPKSSAHKASRLALWLGPDEWLLIDKDGADLMEDCASSGTVHSATDVSHRNIGFVMTGPDAAAAINAGCPLNLSLETFPVGACARTVFGKIEIVLFREKKESFRLECWRSFAEYAFGMLEEGAADAGF